MPNFLNYLCGSKCAVFAAAEPVFFLNYLCGSKYGDKLTLADLLFLNYLCGSKFAVSTMVCNDLVSKLPVRQ